MSRADDLRAALEAGDVEAVRGVLAGLDDAARRALRPVARAAVKRHPMRWERHDEQPFDDAHRVAAAHARFATEPWSALRKGNWVTWRADVSAHGDWVRWALATFTPPWAEHVPDRLLELQDPSYAWQLVMDGLCPRPRTDTWRLAVRWFGCRWNPYGGPADPLAADPQLVVDVYDGLHLVGQADTALSHKWEQGNAWGPGLIEATRDARIPRSGLLSKGLARLAVDLARNQFVWARELIDALAPTEAEVDAHADAWLLVLRSGDAKTVLWALPHVDGLLARGTVTFARVAAMTEGWPDLPAAGAVKGALGWLVQRREEDGGDTLTARAWQAVLHPKPPAAEHAARILVEHGASRREALATQWPEVRPLVGTGVQAVLDPWLGAAVASVRAVDAPQVAAAERPAMSPLSGPEEVLDAWTRWLEHQDDAALLEQILEGTVRYAALAGEPEGRAGLDRLVKRVRTLADGPRAASWGPLVEAWAGAPFVMASWWGPGLDCVQEQRLQEVRALVLAAPGAQVLTTPTHEGFVVDPLAAVQRVAQWPMEEEPVIEGQLLLLRMASEGRAAARAAAASLDSPLGHALRHALGEDITAPAPWASAAALARDGEPAAWSEDSWDIHTEELLPDPHPRVTWTSAIADEPRHVLGSLAAELCATFPSATPANARAYRSYSPVATTSYWAYAFGALSALMKWREVDIACAALLEPLLDPWEPCPPAASAALAAGLGCLQDDVRIVAADVFTVLASDGRLDPQGVGHTVGRLTRSTPPSRWVRRLGLHHEPAMRRARGRGAVAREHGDERALDQVERLVRVEPHLGVFVGVPLDEPVVELEWQRGDLRDGGGEAHMGGTEALGGHVVAGGGAHDGHAAGRVRSHEHAAVATLAHRLELRRPSERSEPVGVGGEAVGREVWAHQSRGAR